MPLHVRDLGRMAYRKAYDVQRETHERVLAGDESPTVLLVEHDPVITVSRRASAATNILVDGPTLARLGIDRATTDRGGDVTYHGPGQLVAYPILPLGPMKMGPASYMRFLEQIVIDTLKQFNVTGERDACATGVWVGGAKIAAVGVRIRRNVTMHGLSLNVTTDLSHFETIIPCGLSCRAVTSLDRLLGPTCPSMAGVKAAVVDQFKSLTYF